MAQLTIDINSEAEPTFDETKKRRNFCFTLNNYTDREIYNLQELAETGKVIYICWGRETAPTTGTPHLQGYVEFKEGRAKRAIVKDKAFQRASLHPRAPTSSKIKAVTYCFKEFALDVRKQDEINDLKKDLQISEEEFLRHPKFLEMDARHKNLQSKDILPWMRSPKGIKVWRKAFDNIREQAGFNQVFEAGNWDHGLKPGTRTDIEMIRDAVNKRVPVTELFEITNSYQALQFGLKYMSYRPLNQNRVPPAIYWVYGPSRAGKSHLCRQNAIGSYWESSRGVNWFDGYTGQKTVIFDDFRFKKGEYEWVLRLTDRYALRVEVKGASVEFCPELIFFTSTLSPSEAIINDDSDLNGEQFINRLSGIVYVNPPDTPHVPPVHPLTDQIEAGIKSNPLVKLVTKDEYLSGTPVTAPAVNSIINSPPTPSRGLRSPVISGAATSKTQPSAANTPPSAAHSIAPWNDAMTNSLKPIPKGIPRGSVAEKQRLRYEKEAFLKAENDRATEHARFIYEQAKHEANAALELKEGKALIAKLGQLKP